MDSRRIEKTAADWIARRDSGQWEERDERDLEHWLAQNTAHRVALLRMKNTWSQADRLQALGAGVERGSIPAPGQWRVSSFSTPNHPVTPAAHHSVQRRKPALRFGPVAALIALAVGVVTLGYVSKLESNSYRTAVGSVESVPLADGSRITLNTDSRIRVALNASERRIDLERGEAFFEVASDPARPFVVHTAGKRIVAIGTQFSVLSTGQEVRVVVTEGMVRIENTDLPAGSVAQAGAGGVLITASHAPEIAEHYLTWRQGYIAFHDTPLADAVAELNRYNKRQLIIEDPALGALRVGGNVRATNLDAFVRVLERGFPVRAVERGEDLVLALR